MLGLQASPDFKGIKTGQLARATVEQSFKPALISKGLRPKRLYDFDSLSVLQASPDFKGIKTRSSGASSVTRLQASPDFKGIKTHPSRLMSMF